MSAAFQDSPASPLLRLSPRSEHGLAARGTSWLFSFCASDRLLEDEDDEEEGDGSCCAMFGRNQTMASHDRVFLPRLASLVRYSSPQSGGRSASGSLSNSRVAEARRLRENSISREGDPEVVRKLVLLGARDSGKSSVALRFSEKKFGGQYDPTIETLLRAQICFSGVTFTCELLDTAGQDEYSTFSRQSLLGVHGFCLFFSITSLQSFMAVQKIHDRLSELVGFFAVPMVLVGAKCDDETRRQVSKAQGEAMADTWGCSYVECSAKSNYGIDEIFITLLCEIEKDSGLLDIKPPTSAVEHPRGDRCELQ